jgi:uncharacterized protein YndB with AHSA1/START domain
MKSLSLTRVLPANISRVFEACTQPELMSRWLVCCADGSATAWSDLRLGGTYRIEMTRGGKAIGAAYGEYLEIQAPRRLVFTWNSDNAGVRDSVVTIELKELGRETELTLIHTLDPDTNEGRAHARGWTVSISNLERLLGEGR